MGEPRVHVRIFGLLRAPAAELGLPTAFEVEVPAEGQSARDVAVGLGLPAERIEGVFINHVVHGLGATVRPGDEIAFVPHGTPGPHRFFLGLYSAGSESDHGE